MSYSFIFLRPQIDFKSLGLEYSVLAGLAATSAATAFYSALNSGKARIVVSLTALYPIVTLLCTNFK